MNSRRPIGLSLLTQLVLAANSVISDTYMQHTIAAMFVLAFHGFLRIGEITIRTGVSPTCLL